MKALILKRYGDKQVDFADVQKPQIKPDELLVQIYAAGLNNLLTIQIEKIAIFFVNF